MNFSITIQSHHIRESSPPTCRIIRSTYRHYAGFNIFPICSFRCDISQISTVQCQESTNRIRYICNYTSKCAFIIIRDSTFRRNISIQLNILIITSNSQNNFCTIQYPSIIRKIGLETKWLIISTYPSKIICTNHYIFFIIRISESRTITYRHCPVFPNLQTSIMICKCILERGIRSCCRNHWGERLPPPRSKVTCSQLCARFCERHGNRTISHYQIRIIDCQA